MSPNNNDDVRIALKSIFSEELPEYELNFQLIVETEDNNTVKRDESL